MRTVALVVVLAALTACQAKEDQKVATAEPAAATTTAPATRAQTNMPTTALTGAEAVAAQKLRHDNFEKLGDAMKLASREAKASAPDMIKVKLVTAEIAALSTALPSWFTPGTGPDAGKTEAKANIWQTPDDFMVKAKDFHGAAQSLNDAATSGDAAAFKAAMEPLGKACKACHDTYREKD